MEELALALREGRATDAEREELALYASAHPEAAALMRRAEAEDAVGGAWLDRVQADARIVAVESSPYTRAERRVGVGLVAAGLVGAFVFPPAATLAAVGTLVLAVSVLRTKLQTAGRDPYDDIER